MSQRDRGGLWRMVLAYVLGVIAGGDGAASWLAVAAMSCILFGKSLRSSEQ